MVPPALHKAFIDAGATVHMMKEVAVLICRPLISNISIGKATKNPIKETTQGEFVINLSGGETPATLNRVLYVPDVKFRSDFVSSTFITIHTVEFRNLKCVMEKDNYVIDTGDCAG